MWIVCLVYCQYTWEALSLNLLREEIFRWSLEYVSSLSVFNLHWLFLCPAFLSSIFLLFSLGNVAVLYPRLFFLSLLYIFINTFFIFLSLKASLSPSYQLQTFTTSGELFPPVAQLRNLSMRQALTLCLLTTSTFSIGDCPRVPRKPFGLIIFTTVKVTRGA